MRVIRTVSALSLTHNSRILMISSLSTQTPISQMQSTSSTEQLSFGHASSLPAALASSALSGPFEGEAEVHGVIPAWLSGRLIRTAPAIFEFDGWRAQHWFDALGMLYSFEIGTNGRVHWMQRLLECEFNRSVLHGRNELASFGTRNHRGLLQRLLHPTPRSTDNANVNIRPEGRHWIAMTETERQLSIDPASLKTAAEARFADALPNVRLISAHPHDDAERKELINIGVFFGVRSGLIVFSQAYGSAARREIGRVPLRRVPYIHSFAITRTKIVLILAPSDLMPASLLWSKRPLSEHYRWSPEKGTRIVVMDRGSGKFVEHEGPPFFFFHTVNAFDLDEGAIRLELLAYDDASIIGKGMMMSDIRRKGLPSLTPNLRRITIDPKRSDFRMDAVGPPVGFEFPMIHYSRANGRRYRYIWGSDLSRLVRFDTTTDEATHRSLDGVTFGEPVFVANPEGSEEDDGVLLTVGSSVISRGSEMTIWDARTLEILARATVPIAIPVGFHGGFEPR
jgi:beta,beta-carotene 9',10'-dioxygenase